jgi:hypothetical protein
MKTVIAILAVAFLAITPAAAKSVAPGHHAKGVHGASSFAPGHVKRTHMQRSARMVAPGHLKR